MEPKNDNTWLLVGAAAGCGLLALLLVCGAAGALFWVTARSAPTPVTPAPMPSPMPMPPSVAPSLPPPPLLPPLPPGTSGETDTAPRTVRATVTSVTGSPVATAGQSCEFNVERRDRDDGSFWCNAQMVCGGHLLYGGPTAGFFPCTLYAGPPRNVVGNDPTTTREDQDPAMTLSTIDGTLEIWDDASGPNGEFHLAAHVDSVE
jgi:hypothetical protein